MKILAILLSFVICFSVLAGCDSERDKFRDENDSVEDIFVSEEVKNFMSYVKDGNEERAVYCFNKDIKGNYQLENEAIEQIEKLLNDINKDILSGKKNSSDSQKITSVINDVIQQTEVKIEQYEEKKEDIAVSLASKEAFAKAQELEEKGNYQQAIKEYEKVINTDSNYSKAKTAIEKCKEKIDVYEKQFISLHYYFEQGYPVNWTFKEGKNGNYIKKIDQYADGTVNNYIKDCGLVAQFSPTANPEKAKYSVYCLRYPFMRATGGDFLLGLVGMSELYDFFFNDLFIENDENKPRENFVWTTEVEDTEESIISTTAHYNKIQFQKVAYNFTVDGTDWKGVLLVTPSKEGFYVITLEAAADAWDANYKVMEKMLSDFRMRGWETRE